MMYNARTKHTSMCNQPAPALPAAPPPLPSLSLSLPVPPEGLLDYSVDIFAFGILMWELISACPLYLGLSQGAIAARVVEQVCRVCVFRQLDRRQTGLRSEWRLQPMNAHFPEVLKGAAYVVAVCQCITAG